MSKTITLDRVPLGGIFTLDGMRFVKLNGDNEAAFVLTEDTPADMGFVQFEDDDASRDDHNNFNGSLVQKEIERWVRDKHKPIFDAIVERPIDLTTMDGMTDYGCPLTVARILTIDEYRKHRRFIPLTDKPYWLATGWTTASSPSSDTGARTTSTPTARCAAAASTAPTSRRVPLFIFNLKSLYPSRTARRARNCPTTPSWSFWVNSSGEYRNDPLGVETDAVVALPFPSGRGGAGGDLRLVLHSPGHPRAACPGAGGPGGGSVCYRGGRSGARPGNGGGTGADGVG